MFRIVLGLAVGSCMHMTNVSPATAQQGASYTFVDWSTSNTTVECEKTTGNTFPRTRNGNCELAQVLVSGGKDDNGSAVACKGINPQTDSNPGAGTFTHHYVECAVERTDITYKPKVQGAVCRMDVGFDTRAYDESYIINTPDKTRYQALYFGIRLTQDGNVVDLLLNSHPTSVRVVTDNTTWVSFFRSFTLSFVGDAGIDLSATGNTVQFGIYVERESSTHNDTYTQVNQVFDNLVYKFVVDADSDGVCDDLDNLASGDDCSVNGSTSCASGFCDPNTNTCADVCGNGVRDANEACDSIEEGCSERCLLLDGGPCASNAQCDRGACDVTTNHVCNSTDSDGDGVPDTIETQQGTDPNDNNDRKDTDSDGDPDFVEERDGTDSNDSNSEPVDSDGDGVPDSVEDDAGTNANDPNDFPDNDVDGRPDYVGDNTVMTDDETQPEEPEAGATTNRPFFRGGGGSCSATAIASTPASWFWSALLFGVVVALVTRRRHWPQSQPSVRRIRAWWCARVGGDGCTSTTSRRLQ